MLQRPTEESNANSLEPQWLNDALHSLDKQFGSRLLSSTVLRPSYETPLPPSNGCAFLVRDSVGRLAAVSTMPEKAKPTVDLYCPSIDNDEIDDVAELVLHAVSSARSRGDTILVE